MTMDVGMPSVVLKRKLEQKALISVRANCLKMPSVMQYLPVFFSLVSLTVAAPHKRASATPTVTIVSPQATIVGLGGTVEQFPGIPFAQPPVGPLRLKPPQPLTEPLGTISATANGKACPQFYFSDAINDAIPTSVLGLLLDTPLFQTTLNAGEDCLVINVHRPAGTTASSNLPVLFWIFGGGFELGYNSMYDGAGWVSESVAQGKPIIFVSVNYRVAGFGFLPGAEILADGSANLGLLDQRLGLQWVADNIAGFGGDPDKVTIWGESAGAISVFDQMALYDGDINYKGKPLFRAGIMNSGSIVPAEPVDGPKGQIVYDTVVASAGCSSATDTLECLRELPYETLLNATNSVPALLSYSSIALSYLPRPDGTVLTASPEMLVAEGRYAKIPFIIGDQEDEGTIFALFQSNITTTSQLATYLKDFFFHDATASQVEGLIATYPDTTTDGSPFRTGILYDLYPQYKRIAAILGDLSFTLTRRAFLSFANTINPSVPSWSYLSSYDYGTPFLGTFHASDILQVFFGTLPNYASASFQTYYLSFVYTMDPNNGTSYMEWPRWSTSNELLNTYATGAVLIADDFRSDSYNFIVDNVASLHI
jgi:carboxylesterase type B